MTANPKPLLSFPPLRRCLRLLPDTQSTLRAPPSPTNARLLEPYVTPLSVPTASPMKRNAHAQVTFFTNSLTVLGMLVSTAANGNLAEFLSYAVTSRTAVTHMVSPVYMHTYVHTNTTAACYGA